MKTRNMSLLGIVASVLVLTLVSSSAYAYQESVTLPRSDYDSKDSYITVIPNQDKWKFIIEYLFSESGVLTTPDNKGVIIPLDPEATDEEIEKVLRQLKAFLDDSLDLKGKDSGTPTTPDTPVKKTADPVDAKVKEIEKCFGGLEQSGAFQAEYEIDKIVRQAKRDLDKLDRLAEECHAIESYLRPFANMAYNSTVVREDTSYKTLPHELKMSAGTQVTADKMKAQAEIARQYIKGTSWMNNILQPSYQSLDEAKMTQQRNEQQIQNEISALKKAKQAGKMEGRESACETAWYNSAGYGHVAVKWWRDILKTPEVVPGLAYYCDEYLSKEFMNWTTNDRFDTLKEARDYRNSLDATIKAGRQ